MKFLRTLITLAALAFASPAAAQLPPINAVAGPTSSAELRRIITDENGTGALLFGGADGNSLVNLNASALATGAVPVARLPAAGVTTINGTPCIIGSSCTVTASATSATVGTTDILSGTSNGVLYNNAGKLGNLATIASGVLVTTGVGVPLISTTLPAVNASAVTGLTASQVAYTPPGVGAVNESVQTYLGRWFYVDQYNPPRNFVGDDSAAIMSAINAADAAGGGTVFIGPYAYWAQAGSITVPRTVSLECSTYAGKLVIGSSAYEVNDKPCSIYFASGNSLVLNSGAIKNINIFSDIFQFSSPGTTRAQMRSFINSFSGYGVVIGNGVNSGVADNSNVINVMIGGFNRCVVQDFAMQVVYQDVLMDCTNAVYIDNSFDDNRLRNVQQWQYSTTNKSQTFDSWNIATATNNGSGLWRLTFAAPTNIVNGEGLWVGRGTGAEGTGGYWNVTLIDPSTVDLQGSAFAPTTTGDTTINSTFIPVASTANLQPGMTVSGSGIPVGATIGAVWRSRSAISLDQAHVATATAAGVSLTFGSNAYTPNSATLAYDGTWRDGIGFEFLRADGTTGEGLFVFGTREGFKFDGTTGLSLVNTQVDAISHLANQNSLPIGLYFAGTQTYANYVSGSLLTTGGVAVLHAPTNAAGSYGNNVVGFRPASSYNLQTALEVGGTGAVVMRGMTDGATKNILLDAAAATPVIDGPSLSAASVYGTGVAPTWLTGQVGGSLGYRYATKIGGQSIDVAAPLAPTLNFYQGLATTDSKYWRLFMSSSDNSLCWQTANDAYNAAANAICATRSGNTVTAVNLTGTSINLTGAVGITGITTFNTSGTTGLRQLNVLNAINSAPAANDGLYTSTMITNSSSSQVEAVRQTSRLSTVTAGAETGQIYWSIRTAGALVDELLLTGGTLTPIGNAGLDLGAGTLGWKNMYFARGTTTVAGPGAATGMLELVCGTNAGTARLQIKAGTSNTPVTISDNVGSGVSGC